MARPRSSFRSIFNAFLTVLLFVIISSTLVGLTNGYTYDFSSNQFTQTGIISLTVKQMPVTVSIDGKKKLYKKTPINLTYLVPGQYTVEIRKEGYYPWVKTFRIKAGEVKVNPFVRLYLTEINPQPATSKEADMVANATMVAPDLDIRLYEIWIKPISRTYPFTVTSDRFAFVGRYAKPVHGAIWTEDKTNIIFQVGNEIRLIDRDGTNDHLLVSLSSDQATRFAITSDGNALIYQDGDMMYRRQLQ
ncbi:MAG TPA: PEGA domain-containing protein [Patescibacteria group bacterium]